MEEGDGCVGLVVLFSGGVVALVFLGGLEGSVCLVGAEVEDVFGVLGFADGDEAEFGEEGADFFFGFGVRGGVEEGEAEVAWSVGDLALELVGFVETGFDVADAEEADFVGARAGLEALHVLVEGGVVMDFADVAGVVLDAEEFPDGCHEEGFFDFEELFGGGEGVFAVEEKVELLGVVVGEVGEEDGAGVEGFEVCGDF